MLYHIHNYILFPNTNFYFSLEANGFVHFVGRFLNYQILKMSYDLVFVKLPV